jgi:hypothetical protein
LGQLQTTAPQKGYAPPVRSITRQDPLPPYDSPSSAPSSRNAPSGKHRDFWIWSREETHRYFLAGGGRDVEFDALWTVAIRGREKCDKSIDDRTYAGAGSGISYLVAGRKP